MNAKLAEVMPAELKRKERQHDMVEAVFIKKLARHMESHDAVAKKLGMTGSSISTILRDGKTRRTNELAARYVWDKEYGNEGGGKLRTAVLIAESHIIKTAKSMVDAAGGQLFIMPEKAGEQ